MGHPDAEYEKSEPDEVRCPNCGNEDELVKQEAANKYAQPVPPKHKMYCPECDSNGSPARWHGEYTWHRMSDEERQEHREQREKAMDKMAAWQSSAAYHAEQRQP